MVEEDCYELVAVPATYRTDTKQVLVSPARVVWKVGRGLAEKTGSRVTFPACARDAKFPLFLHRMAWYSDINFSGGN
jgi:hypothetical protein